VVGEVRIDSSRGEKTIFVIVAAQSVKYTDTAEQKGYDAGKKVFGIKRHITVVYARASPCDSGCRRQLRRLGGLL